MICLRLLFIVDFEFIYMRMDILSKIKLLYF